MSIFSTSNLMTLSYIADFWRFAIQRELISQTPT
jgi:hypothetical protein